MLRILGALIATIAASAVCFYFYVFFALGSDTGIFVTAVLSLAMMSVAGGAIFLVMRKGKHAALCYLAFFFAIFALLGYHTKNRADAEIKASAMRAKQN